jgi:2-dehydropantoate 2-reductase
VRYVIIGAGAIGGSIGALLIEAGQDVVLVASGKHLRALQETGLRFATPAGVSTFAVTAVGGPDEVELGPDDVLVLCVKSQDTESALTDWAARPVAGGGVAADRLPLICAQNGVENERVALRRFTHVFGMSVLLPSSYLEPGLVTAVSDPVVGVLMFGRYPEGRAPGNSDPGNSGSAPDNSDPDNHTDSSHPDGSHPGNGDPDGADVIAEKIAADLSTPRLVTTLVPDIQRWKYAKLLRNLVNAIEAVCGPVSADPDAERLLDLAVQEAEAVFAAAGVDRAGDAEQAPYLARLIRKDVLGQPLGGGSSWQSVTRGVGTIESDYLNGEIALLARLHHRPAPVNATLQRLAVHAAATGRSPGSTTAGQVLAGLG